MFYGWYKCSIQIIVSKNVWLLFDVCSQLFWVVSLNQCYIHFLCISSQITAQTCNISENFNWICQWIIGGFQVWNWFDTRHFWFYQPPFISLFSILVPFFVQDTGYLHNREQRVEIAKNIFNNSMIMDCFRMLLLSN